MRIRHHHPRPLLATTDRAQRRGGYILVEFAFLLVPLLLMVGLSVDVGYWYNRVSDIQKAADAAALAGVVWLPDVDKAEQYALEAAARNGFVDGVDGIDIDIAQVGERRLRVTIRDPQVGSFFFENLGGRTIDLSRRGTAEYVLPVPLGSPRNFFGTGPLPSGYSENLWLSVNTWCTDKVDGDRYQSPFDGNRPYSTSDTRCPTTHSGTYANPEYRARGYEYYIDVPEDRTGDIDVLLFDARYNQWAQQSAAGSELASCTWYPDGNIIAVIGPAQYQVRDSTTGSGSTWSGTQDLPPGHVLTRNRNLVRYRLSGSTWYPNGNTLAIQGSTRYRVNNGAIVHLAAGAVTNQNRTTVSYEYCVDQIDHMLYPGDHNFTYSLYAADDTPLNDADNPAVPDCSRTFTSTTLYDPTSFLGQSQWNRLCTITTAMETGRYILRVTNTTGSRFAAGANNFSLVAKYTSAPYTAAGALCDARTVATCPRVYGKDAISVFANETSSTADFFLAEIDPIHRGKTLQIELYDPGEGGNNIRMRRPTGSNSWQDAQFTWSSTNSSYASGGPTSSLDVTGDRFNGHTVRILINLDSYNPPGDNWWWQVRYNFSSNRDVTDRTTWSAQVLGDPVHLIEEDL